MRVLVTGGCGFIGSHLVDRLVGDGHHVTVLDNLSSGTQANLSSQATFVKGDVADTHAVAPLVKESDAVFHLAAVASVEACRTDAANAHRTNFTGTVTVFDAAAKAGGVPVVYASSAAVYGDNPNIPLAETAETNPLSLYGEDKLACEHHGITAWERQGVPNVGLRFFNVYGPRQDAASPYSGVISRFVAKAKAKQPFTFFGDGGQTRDFIYVGDIVELMVKAAAAGCNREVFNGCTGKTTSIRTLASAIARLAGIEMKAETKPARDGDIRHSQGNPLKAATVLGFNARTPLENGLAALMEHADA